MRSTSRPDHLTFLELRAEPNAVDDATGVPGYDSLDDATGGAGV
jgi:hypothetical protein